MPQVRPPLPRHRLREFANFGTARLWNHPRQQSRATSAPAATPAFPPRRVKVEGDLSVKGHPEIFVVGDTASAIQDGRPLPGVAQVAMQGGRYVGKVIRRRLQHNSAPRPFRYFDKGNMAVVGKGFAIIQSGKVRVSGFIAWLAWVYVHLSFLAARGLRISVFVQWVWTYFAGSRGSRLIVHDHASIGDVAQLDSAHVEQSGSAKAA